MTPIGCKVPEHRVGPQFSGFSGVHPIEWRVSGVLHDQNDDNNKNAIQLLLIKKLISNSKGHQHNEKVMMSGGTADRMGTSILR